jgi:acyl-CoA dehydrogenase
MSVLVHTDMSSPYLYKYGSEALKQKFLPAMIRGEKVGAIAPHRARRRAPISQPCVRLRKRKGAYYILNGSKTFHHQRPQR